MIKDCIKELKQRIRGGVPIRKLIITGMTVESNFQYGAGSTFDISHCWLISVGNNTSVRVTPER